MITVIAKTNFNDKYTGEKYTAGKELNFENERAKELLDDNRNLVELKEIVKVTEIETAVKQEPNKQTAIKKTAVKSIAKRKANAKK